MKRGKWIVATTMLALGLSAGAFAENQSWDGGGNRDGAFYTQHDTRDRAQSWNQGYRDNDDRDRAWDNRDRDRDDRYRGHDDYRDRDDHYRNRDQDRDHGRRDRDDRGRDRD